MPADEDEGMGIIPINSGDYSARELGQFLSGYAILPKQAKRFFRLYIADSGLCVPARHTVSLPPIGNLPPHARH